MKSVNKVLLLGYIGQPPEAKALSKGGTLRTEVSLATNDRYKQGDEWKDRTDWHTVLFYGRLAEIARDYLHKGSKVMVEGRIRNDSWDDKDSGRKQYRTRIVATDVTLLDSRDNRPPEPPAEVDEEDVPF